MMRFQLEQERARQDAEIKMREHQMTAAMKVEEHSMRKAEASARTNGGGA
jgi:hypothetical protein